MKKKKQWMDIMLSLACMALGMSGITKAILDCIPAECSTGLLAAGIAFYCLLFTGVYTGLSRNGSNRPFFVTLAGGAAVTVLQRKAAGRGLAAFAQALTAEIHGSGQNSFFLTEAGSETEASIFLLALLFWVALLLGYAVVWKNSRWLCWMFFFFLFCGGLLLHRILSLSALLSLSLFLLVVTAGDFTARRNGNLSPKKAGLVMCLFALFAMLLVRLLVMPLLESREETLHQLSLGFRVAVQETFSPQKDREAEEVSGKRENQVSNEGEGDFEEEMDSSEQGADSQSIEKNKDTGSPKEEQREETTEAEQKEQKREAAEEERNEQEEQKKKRKPHIIMLLAVLLLLLAGIVCMILKKYYFKKIVTGEPRKAVLWLFEKSCRNMKKQGLSEGISPFSEDFAGEIARLYPEIPTGEAERIMEAVLRAAFSREKVTKEDVKALQRLYNRVI